MPGGLESEMLSGAAGVKVRSGNETLAQEGRVVLEAGSAGAWWASRAASRLLAALEVEPQADRGDNNDTRWRRP